MSPRRRQILEALARELEEKPGARITTARLAHLVGVSEAALYRHFPSKAAMFAALIEFAEETVFNAIAHIVREDRDELAKCGAILHSLLTFSLRNPGITRVLLGDALVGEEAHLQQRVHQYFERLETQLRQVLREGALVPQSAQPERSALQRLLAKHGQSTVGPLAGLMMAAAVGRMHQYLRTGFRDSPLDGWPEQWELLIDHD